MKKRKILSLALALVMVLALVSVPAAAETVEGRQLYTTKVNDSRYWEKRPRAGVLLAFLEYRESLGLEPLLPNPMLEKAAAQRAAELSVYYSDTRPNFNVYSTAIEGHEGNTLVEIISVGFDTTEYEEWIRALIDYDDTRRALEDERLTRFSFGCFTASDNTTYWVLLLSSGGNAAERDWRGGQISKVTVAKKLLNLLPWPASLDLNAGDAKTVRLYNQNQGFTSGISMIYATSVSCQDPTVATVEIEANGTVTVTGVKGGSTTVQVGLAAVEDGQPPITVDVPVTVTGESPEPQPTAITETMFTVDTADETYTGEAVTKTITGMDGEKTLVEDTDYTVTYENNTEVGTATITITGIGDYTGTLTYTFVIKAADSGDTGGSTGGNTGGNTGGSTGGNTGGNTGGSTGGNTGGNTGGTTGGTTGGNMGGSTGGTTGGSAGGSTDGSADDPAGGSSGEESMKPASELFDDVVSGSWYEPGVTFAVHKGLFQGVSEWSFAPDTDMTRAMLMTVLARLDGQNTSGGNPWYQKGMAWAVFNGISDGTNPEVNITREQIVTMLYRYAGEKAETEVDLTAFVDAESISDWAKEAVDWAVSQGILVGKDGNRLDPQGAATRAEVATILQRFVENAQA